MTTFISNLDINRRPDPILSQVDFLTAENFKRIATVAIPILSLHQGLATALSLGSAAGQVYNHLQEETPDVKKMACLAGTAALFIFNPTMGLFLTHGSTIVMDLYTGEWSQDTLSRVIYLASAYYGTPLLVTASLLMQACSELREAKAEYEEGRYLEMTGKLLTGLIRSGKAYSQGRQYYLEKFGKEITQSDWDKVIEELKQRIEGDEDSFRQEFMTQRAWNAIKYTLFGQSDFELILDENNFRREIQGIKMNEDDFAYMEIRNVSFIDCEMNTVSFNKAAIENVRFQQCLMQTADFAQATLNQVNFVLSDLSGASFYKARLQNCSFIRSDLSCVAFNNSELERVEILLSQLFGANFLHAQTNEAKLTDCDLTDVLLADAKEKLSYENCTENFFTRPIIALGWDFGSYSWSTDVNEALNDQGALVLKHSFVLKEVNADGLYNEVQQGIKTYRGEGESIPQHLLRKGPWGAETKKIYESAKFIGEYADGAIIPGGADVEKEFYQPCEQTWSTDYRKSMKEYAVIHEFVTREKPLMGICRGAQITNTYFPGGTIKDVPSQFGQQQLEFESTAAGEKVKKIVGCELWGSSAHNQAVDQVGEGLEIALKADGVIKALMSKDGNILLTQFHPEHYLEAPKEGEQLNSEGLTYLSMHAIGQLWENGKPITPELHQIEGERIEVNRLLLDQWILQFEMIVNETLKGVQKLRKNSKLIGYFLGRAVHKIDVAAAAA